MITRDDAVDLLKLAAAYDQRTVGDEDITAWMLAGRIGRWTKPLGVRVIAEHYATDSERPRIDPRRITDAIKAVRRRAAESFDAPRIPEGLGGLAYVRWYRGELDAHVAILLGRWADGEDIPAGIPAAQREQLGPGPTPEQRAAIAAFAERTRIPEA